jgi:hypothetical protein
MSNTALPAGVAAEHATFRLPHGLRLDIMQHAACVAEAAGTARRRAESEAAMAKMVARGLSVVRLVGAALPPLVDTTPEAAALTRARLLDAVAGVPESVAARLVVETTTHCDLLHLHQFTNTATRAAAKAQYVAYLAGAAAAVPPAPAYSPPPTFMTLPPHLTYSTLDALVARGDFVWAKNEKQSHQTQ